MNYLITNPDNIFYLTGYKASTEERECYLLLRTEFEELPARDKLLESAELYLFTYKMLFAQIKSLVTDKVKLREISRELTLAESISEIIGEEELLFEDSDLKVSEYNRLLEKLSSDKFIGSKISKELLNVRAIKTEFEIQLVEKAVSVAETAFTNWVESIRIQIGVITEKEAAWELRLELIKAGADGIAFPPIVATGKNSAFPHHQSGADILKKGEVILVDWGATVSGYHSDMTRTFTFGEPNNSGYLRDLGLVKAAYDSAIAAINENKSVDEIVDLVDIALDDRVADMIHSLGHGIGVAVHELPGLSSSEEQLPVNSVVTIEPGVYLEAKYGIRLEKTVVITEDGVRELGELDLLFRPDTNRV